MDASGTRAAPMVKETIAELTSSRLTPNSLAIGMILPITGVNSAPRSRPNSMVFWNLAATVLA